MQLTIIKYSRPNNDPYFPLDGIDVELLAVGVYIDANKHETILHA